MVWSSEEMSWIVLPIAIFFFLLLLIERFGLSQKKDSTPSLDLIAKQKCRQTVQECTRQDETHPLRHLEMLLHGCEPRCHDQISTISTGYTGECPLPD